MGQPHKAPLHLPIAMGVTSGFYAVALAGITALQAQADRAVIAGQQPFTDSLSSLAQRRTVLERDVGATISSLNHAGLSYNDSLQEATALHERLTTLAQQVTIATGAAAQIPSSQRLPSAATPLTAAPAPATQATTGASGKP